MNKYKQFFIMILLLSKGICSNAQDLESTIKIKGYYVSQFSKDEILFSYDQKLNRLKGESFSTPIDFKQVSFFVPIQINNVTVLNEEDVTKHFFPYEITTDSLFYVPVSTDIQKYVKKTLNLDIDVSKEICIVSEAMRTSSYYTIDADSRYIYKCVYLEGNAQELMIAKNRKERLKLNSNLGVYSILRESRHSNFFLITKIQNYNPIIDIQNLIKWLPYLD